MNGQRQGRVFDPGQDRVFHPGQDRAFEPGQGRVSASVHPSSSQPVPTPRSSSSNRTEPPSEEDPLQNPRPPELRKNSQNGVDQRCSEESFKHRAKRWSARISSGASVLWGGGGEVPPPVPRHRDPAKYNQTTSHTNHIRLFERKTRAYTCKELLCIVFLPCLLICLLGIALSSLVIYYRIGQEYENEIEILEKELSRAREKDGVYLSSHKYSELVSLANNKKLDQQDEVTELRSENTLRRLEVEDLRLEAGRRRAELEELRLEAARRRVEVEEMEGKITDLRDTLDCTYTVVQSGGQSLQGQLEKECKLSQRAQLLLTLSDQAVESRPAANSLLSSKQRHKGSRDGKPKPKHSDRVEEFQAKPKESPYGKDGHPFGGGAGHAAGRVHHQSNEGGQHWLLGSDRSGKSGEFEGFLVTELSRMEQNIIDFSIQHNTFCSGFRLSLEGEMERRSQDLTQLVNKLVYLIDHQAKGIGKLEGLASDQMYAEQAWVTSYLKNIRNEADRQSSSLQGFLTSSLLPSVRLINSAVLKISNQVSEMEGGMRQTLRKGNMELNAFLNSQKKLILSTKDKIVNLGQHQTSDIQVLLERQEELVKAEAKFETRFKEAQRKINGLMSSVMDEYVQYSSVFNSTASRTANTLDGMSSRSESIDSALTIASSALLGEAEGLRRTHEQDQLKVDSAISGAMEESGAAIKVLGAEVEKVGVQGKQLVGERQGAWELHYANSEIMLRKKSDTNKELLKKHQVQTQETHTSLLQFSNQLDQLTDHQRQADQQQTADRQADLQTTCKAVSSFSNLLTSELHARDSDLANYLAKDRN